MDQAPASTRFPDDCLPPENEYESRETLHAAINAWAGPRGYAFVTGKSTKTASGRRTVIFSCDRGGQPPKATTARKRLTSTRRIGCRFSVLAKESLDKTKWRLSHRPGNESAHHNHQPSESVSVHPVLRQLSDVDKSTIIKLANAGVAPRQISTYLKQNTEALATQQDIYNCITQYRRHQEKDLKTKKETS